MDSFLRRMSATVDQDTPEVFLANSSSVSGRTTGGW